jgi:hypothetical protein
MPETSAASSSAADDDTPADESGAEPEAAVEAEAGGFANRAARRAKGKSTSKPEVFSKGQRPVGRGAVQSPRQYGNRRSG